ncbi:competence type IV pilus major pilin ComGC [Robertmurraya kyonggiensis]|uniref:ComG operon protein 3 n=1 Tax=Robertmurraya kyonggiensis TaxID=1037680 RepID=A0A4V5P1Z2_9BACI|nr:competence type IV pilus major pilin ComGC [Robertmurraya kyonggiensis]TKC19890.1 prepilin-type N-terminal cleavage/methylation domain-containing protein [Robertmurraya kyonggiensis]
MKNKRSTTLSQWLKQHKESGFTLIEMLIVLLVISVLLIITIPNVTKHNSTINTKGCQAFVKMVEAQVQAFQMDNQKMPSGLADLQTAGYLNNEQDSCPNGDKIEIGSDGEVTLPNSEADATEE